MLLRRLTFVLGLYALAAPCCRAQEVEVPVQVQAPLLLKILAFERNLPSRAGATIDLGILYQERNRSSSDAAQQLTDALAHLPDATVAGLPLKAVPIVWTDGLDLEATLRNAGVDVLFVCPLRAAAIEDVAAATQKLKIRSFGSVASDVGKGLSVGLATRKEKPLIVVNLPAAKAEGSDFESSLLKLAKVLNGPEDRK